MMMGMTKKLFETPSAIRRWILRALKLIIAGYGIYAFIQREIGSYMFLKNRFAFFDFEEPSYGLYWMISQ